MKIVDYYAKKIGLKAGFIIGISIDDNETVVEECYTYGEAISKVEDWNIPCLEGIYKDSHIRGKDSKNGLCPECAAKE